MIGPNWLHVAARDRVLQLPLAFDSGTPRAYAGNLNVQFVGQTVAEVERHLILDTLDFCSGNRTHAARILGIAIRTLRNKLNEYAEAGILVPEPGRVRAVVTAD